ncbi:MAG TPA: hypothetical protein VFG98_00330, partial [Intrasporangium sp.]|nr:hypothetical protein [Intrasporangium sp.]
MNRINVRSQLLQAGFRDSDSAGADLSRLGAGAEPVLPVLATVGDPDEALAGLVVLAERVSDR